MGSANVGQDKPRALIVEDDAWFAASLAEILATDFATRICPVPDMIFDVMTSWRPDVILADVMLGNKNLLVLLHEMQSDADTRQVPFVVLSAIDERTLRGDDWRAYGVRAVLNKADVKPSKLRQVLRDVARDSVAEHGEKARLNG
jgi:PleD family two-component response regulator